jgi:hypothetical protein
MLIHSAVITGSVQFNNTDVSGITNVSGFATTASVDALVVKTGSYATTSSVNDLQSKTGSYTSTSSFGAYSSSINTFTSSATTRLNTIESVTGSFASTSSVNNLQSVTGSYATTGSNQFNGNQSISGSITSNGTITAQTLVVQTVTSSIEFVTGSTRNGSIAGNTHQFTGSVLMSGSHTVNGGIVTTGASAGYSINRRDTSVYAGGWYAPSSSILLDISGLGTALTITSAGSVGINTSSPTTNVGLTVKRSTGTGWIIDALNSSNIRVGGFYSTGGSNGQLYLANSAGTETIVLDSAGASYFSGSIGIGTSSPTSNFKLEVSSSFDGVSIIASQSSQTLRLSSATNNNTILRINNFNGNFFDIQNQPSDNSLVIDYNDTERMRITSAGDVQVGGNSVLVDRALTEVAVSTYSLPSNGPVQNNGSQTGADCRNYDYSGLIWGTSGATQAQNENAGVSMDFGSAQSIKRIVLYAYDVRNVNSYKVSYSSDNTNWTILRVFPHIVKSGLGPMIFDFNASGLLSFRYWRVQINSWTNRDATNWYLSECIAYI